MSSEQKIIHEWPLVNFTIDRIRQKTKYDSTMIQSPAPKLLYRIQTERRQATPAAKLSQRSDRTSRFCLAVLLAAFLISPLSALGRPQSATATRSRPNIVFILVDDLRWDELGVSGHPYIKSPNIDRVGKEGVVFRNAFMTTPLCSPSRASFLTGQYAHTHGITDNVDRSAASHRLTTFPLLLKHSGYETAFIGKWHMGNDDSPRPGFDRWVSFKGQGSYLNPEFNIDGVSSKSAGYTTDLLSNHAIEFINRPHDKPFVIYLAHKAMHPEVVQNNDGSVNLAEAEVFIPAERHKDLYTGATIPRRPNYAKAPEEQAGSATQDRKPANARSGNRHPRLVDSRTATIINGG